MPLVLLAVPSVCSGWVIGEVVFGDYFGASLPPPDPNYYGLWSFIEHGLVSVPFWLAVLGIFTAWLLYLKKPELPKRIAQALGPAYALVERKYGFDELYAWLFAGGARSLGRGFWRAGDQALIDGLIVNGSARLTGWFSGVVSLLQSGMIYRYASVMLMGVVILAFWFLKN